MLSDAVFVSKTAMIYEWLKASLRSLVRKAESTAHRVSNPQDFLVVSEALLYDSPWIVTDESLVARECFQVRRTRNGFQRFTN